MEYNRYKIDNYFKIFTNPNLEINDDTDNENFNIEITLVKQNYRDNLEEYLRKKIELLNNIFTSSAYWLLHKDFAFDKEEGKIAYFGVFIDFKETIKSNTSILTLTFKSLNSNAYLYVYKEKIDIETYNAISQNYTDLKGFFNANAIVKRDSSSSYIYVRTKDGKSLYAVNSDGYVNTLKCFTNQNTYTDAKYIDIIPFWGYCKTQGGTLTFTDVNMFIPLPYINI